MPGWTTKRATSRTPSYRLGLWQRLRCRGIQLLVSLCIISTAVPAAFAANIPVIFSVTGDVPYGSSEVSVFQDIIDDHNTFSASRFIVHVGDILAGTESCNESRYSTVANILKSSVVPAYIIPGDNETTDCSNPGRGWTYWERHLMGLEENFCGTPSTDRQSSQEENFAFVLDGILFVGIHLVGGGNSSSILQNNADWVEQQFGDHGSSVRGAVIFSQEGPGGDSQFFDPFEDVASAFGKPILFIHGDGHQWKHDYPFSASNVVRVQIDRGDDPPVQVTAGLDPNDMFHFERDPWSGANPIDRGPCGETPQSFTLTTQTQGSGRIDLQPGGGVYLPGTVVDVEALPDPGWTFDSWSGDLSGNTNPETLTLSSDRNIAAVFILNAPPLTVADQYETGEDGTLLVDAPGVLDNDTDPDGDALTAHVIQDPDHGTLQLQADGGFTYQPDADYFGADSFAYEADDGRGGRTEESVAVDITPAADPPTGVSDDYTVAQNTLLQLAAPGLLANDFDPDGQPLSATLQTPPSSGIVQLENDGALRYFPDPDFIGTDSFAYVADDGGTTSAPVTVTLQVAVPSAENTPLAPVADATVLSTAPSTNYGDDDELKVEEDVNVHHAYLRFEVPAGHAILGATLRLYVTNSSNDGGSLYAVSNQYKASSAPWEESGITWSNAPTISGSAIAATGSVAAGNWIELDVSSLVTSPGIYALALQSQSANSVRYSSREGSNPPQLVLSVEPNESPVAINDAFRCAPDAPLVRSAPGVLHNDSDPESGVMQSLLLQQPAQGSVALQPDGSFSYTPTNGFLGVDSFFYAAIDPLNGISMAWVNVHVQSARGERRWGQQVSLGGSRVAWSRPLMTRNAPTLSITVQGEGQHDAVLEIFDVQGRRLRTVSQTILPEALTTLQWRGRSDQGTHVGSGVYFARLRIGNATMQQRIVVLR